MIVILIVFLQRNVNQPLPQRDWMTLLKVKTAHKEGKVVLLRVAWWLFFVNERAEDTCFLYDCPLTLFLFVFLFACHVGTVLKQSTIF